MGTLKKNELILKSSTEFPCSYIKGKSEKRIFVNIPKDKGKPISLMPLSLKYEKRYFKAFTSAMYLEKIDKFFNDQKKKFKKENKRNV